jgi:hypothetical protein
MKPSITLQDYNQTFVQRYPCYNVKMPGLSWTTKNKPLGDPCIKAHLRGQYAVAVRGQWYPAYCILDVDERRQPEAEAIRKDLGLSESNSFLCKSESADSWHIIFRPLYRDQRPRLSQLQTILKSFAKEHRVEIYPQAHHGIRLPFAPCQDILNEDRATLTTWEDKFYWFEKLDEFNLSTVPIHQMYLDVEPPRGKITLPYDPDAKSLLEEGLQAPSTRYHSQFRILLYLWRNNVAPDDAVFKVWDWIRHKHNGFSKDIIKHPKECRKEIDRQATHIWGKYDLGYCLPDTPHNQHEGYITIPDLEEIFMVSGGKIPLARFTYNLVKYGNPRRYHQALNIHSKRLEKWASSHTYVSYLVILEGKGIVRRSSSYLVNSFSKPIHLNWQWHTQDKVVLYDGRALDSLEDACKAVLRPSDLATIMCKAGRSRRKVNEYIQAVFCH